MICAFVHPFNCENTVSGGFSNALTDIFCSTWANVFRLMSCLLCSTTPVPGAGASAPGQQDHRTVRIRPGSPRQPSGNRPSGIRCFGRRRYCQSRSSGRQGTWRRLRFTRRRDARERQRGRLRRRDQRHERHAALVATSTTHPGTCSFDGSPRCVVFRVLFLETWARVLGMVGGPEHQ
jgi:hypothetical protein